MSHETGTENTMTPAITKPMRFDDRSTWPEKWIERCEIIASNLDGTWTAQQIFEHHPQGELFHVNHLFIECLMAREVDERRAAGEKEDIVKADIMRRIPLEPAMEAVRYGYFSKRRVAYPNTDPCQIRVIYSVLGHPEGHPPNVMSKLADELGFRVIGSSFRVIASTSQSIADEWWFWIEFDNEPELPDFLSKAMWLPVGSA
jgi:hypothetical protein